MCNPDETTAYELKISCVQFSVHFFCFSVLLRNVFYIKLLVFPLEFGSNMSVSRLSVF